MVGLCKSIKCFLVGAKWIISVETPLTHCPMFPFCLRTWVLVITDKALRHQMSLRFRAKESHGGYPTLSVSNNKNLTRPVPLSATVFAVLVQQKCTRAEGKGKGTGRLIRYHSHLWDHHSTGQL